MTTVTIIIDTPSSLIARIKLTGKGVCWFCAANDDDCLVEIQMFQLSTKPHPNVLGDPDDPDSRVNPESWCALQHGRLPTASEV
jgi:hypothetical protein